MSGTARTLLQTEGESGRFEFKRQASAVKDEVLVAAANAVLLDDLSEPYVTLLVGVDEVKDEVTGMVTGLVVGIDDLEVAADAIRQRAGRTRPSPIGLTIIEENTATSRPFLRLEISPTFPPHFTENGRRITRYGPSTRAITDEELLGIYLDREAQNFRERFADSVRDVEGALANVSDYVAKIDEALELMQPEVASAAEDASTGAVAAEEAQWAIDELPTQNYFDAMFTDLSEGLRSRYVEDGAVWIALQRARRDGWEMVRLIIASHPKDEDAREAAELLRSLPNASPGAHGQNLEELRGWESLRVMMAIPGFDGGQHLLGVAQEMIERRAAAVRPTRMTDLPPIE